MTKEKEALVTEIDKLHQQNAELSEKVGKQQDLLLQAREDADKDSELHQKEIEELCSEIKSLTVPTKYYDDEHFSDLLSGRSEKLWDWVETHFEDTEELAELGAVLPRGYPSTARHFRIWIKATVARFINNNIFGQAFYGIHARHAEQLGVLEKYVDASCSENTLQHWRLATVLALSKYAAAPETDARQMTLIPIVTDMEARFAKYSTTDQGTRMKELHDILFECVGIKRAVCVQKGQYRFQASSTGTEYDPSSMFSVGEDGEGNVGLSLWPALLKLSGDSGQWQAVLREEVYTMTPEMMSPVVQ
ncbi:hypothetical protein PHISCL_00212 [Aspergillus sclerotialis]|uniref:Uncharacterized protein n=1 Tax=Aspergillus sclerotialis TaxID=2070753 RepID=A0A3A2ZWF4_9EURO|nr:hypothetical protein PHISCL_00212 [Aspergillus sclerotialis]